jgi:ABC-type phosphate transport system substrate-binding protein
MVTSEMARVNGRNALRGTIAMFLLALVCAPVVPAVKNMAVVVSAGSKLADVSLAELVKYCKGGAKAWPDGKNFVLVIKDPDSSDMHVAAQKLFGASGAEARAAIAKLNESHLVVKVATSDDDLLHTVDITPGAIGIVDVYSINSSVKVLRVDGKLPFDAGYPLKGN